MITPHDHDSTCKRGTGLDPDGLDPDNCKRCAGLVRLLDEARERREAAEARIAEGRRA